MQFCISSKLILFYEELKNNIKNMFCCVAPISEISHYLKKKKKSAKHMQTHLEIIPQQLRNQLIKTSRAMIYRENC